MTRRSRDLSAPNEALRRPGRDRAMAELAAQEQRPTMRERATSGTSERAFAASRSARGLEDHHAAIERHRSAATELSLVIHEATQRGDHARADQARAQRELHYDQQVKHDEHLRKNGGYAPQTRATGVSTPRHEVPAHLAKAQMPSQPKAMQRGPRGGMYYMENGRKVYAKK